MATTSEDFALDCASCEPCDIAWKRGQQRDQVQRRAPSRCKLMLALALGGRSSHLTPVKCLKGLPNKQEADSMDGKGCFKNILSGMDERQKVSTSSLPM